MIACSIEDLLSNWTSFIWNVPHFINWKCISNRIRLCVPINPKTTTKLEIDVLCVCVCVRCACVWENLVIHFGYWWIYRIWSTLGYSIFDYSKCADQNFNNVHHACLSDPRSVNGLVLIKRFSSFFVCTDEVSFVSTFIQAIFQSLFLLLIIMGFV